MAINDSPAEWRAYGDWVAYEDWVWAFHARYYAAAAGRLRDIVEAESKPETMTDSTIGCLIAGRFNMALALELIVKAYYLRHGEGPKDAVYTHDTRNLLPPQLLDSEQWEVLRLAFVCVEWAGRYPTPRWDRKNAYEKWDPPTLPDGRVDLNKIPTAASLAEIDRIRAVYDVVYAAYEAPRTPVA